MRYVKIFLLHFEYVFSHPSQSFVYFLIALINPLVMIIFWLGALHTKGVNSQELTVSSITSYYFLLAIVSSFLMAHVENDVAHEDIKQGELVKYLTRPFSYYWFNFFEEIPYRVLQGFFGVLLALVFVWLYGNFFSSIKSWDILVLSILISMFGYLLSFTFKMIVGLVAFWLTDAGGFNQLIEAIIFIFAGFVIPLSLMPYYLEQIAYILPFSYMIYFPVVALQGDLATPELMRILSIQFIWLFVLCLIYSFVWKSGLKKFTGVGQ